MDTYGEAFNLISKPIEDFAKKYNFFVEKYRHDAANWTLCFKRKTGGVAYIYINYLYQTNKSRNSHSNTQFEMGIIWVVDDYETEIRHSIRKTIGKYNFNNDLFRFENLLNKAVDTVKELKYEDLATHDVGMNWKSHWKTKEEFLQSIDFPEVEI